MPPLVTSLLVMKIKKYSYKTRLTVSMLCGMLTQSMQLCNTNISSIFIFEIKTIVTLIMSYQPN